MREREPQILVIDADPGTQSTLAGDPWFAKISMRFANHWRGPLNEIRVGTSTYALVIVAPRFTDISAENLIGSLCMRRGSRAPEVLVLSGLNRPHEVVRMLEAGAHAFLTTPLDLQQLREIVELSLSYAPHESAAPPEPPPTQLGPYRPLLQVYRAPGTQPRSPRDGAHAPDSAVATRHQRSMLR